MYIFRWPVIVFILALFSLLSTTSQHSTCSEAFTKLKDARHLLYCKKLPTLGAEFAWNYNDQDNTTRIDIFFGTRLHAEIGWLAWGVNPTNEPKMVGTRAIIGIRMPNGTMAVDKYNVTSTTKLGCGLQPSEVGFLVEKMEIKYSDTNHYFTISASLYLPEPEYNISRLNHVWQVGYQSIGKGPLMHPKSLQNVDSAETINLRTGVSEGVGQHRHHLRKVHGILNIVGWGIFLPVGVMAVRYLRVHPKETRWWFKLHVSCQIVGYILGTFGWIIGLWLGHASKHYVFPKHRTLSIFIFTFSTLQMLALRLKPKRRDEYRKFWNLYHHFLGYALLAAISVDIFLGIGILKPLDHAWKWSYFGVIGILGVIFLLFEIYSWCKFLNKKNPKPEVPQVSEQQQQNK
ncbi:hypothetical protein Ddye_027585 [Dipteronia dyeriana]|uniref:Cytochrome b561 and DOMON domain-containing protein n=1 Tax=Dipteronia dyeriana TaxID=168575 RepID=A0AAD9TQB3_9ROSI|nr:hypothetical protein Ddye_027585 [Dipteronia dyeriana]